MNAITIAGMAAGFWAYRKKTTSTWEPNLSATWRAILSLLSGEPGPLAQTRISVTGMSNSHDRWAGARIPS